MKLLSRSVDRSPARSRRHLVAISVSLAILTLGVATPSRAVHSTSGEQSEADALARLHTLPCPDYEVRFERNHSEADKQAATAGSFWVFERWVTLVPPIDWNQAGSRSYLSQLHSMFFIDILLQMYTAESDEADFDQALAITLDWIDSNEQGAPSTNSLAWYNKVVGDRAPYIAYLTRIGACRGVLEDQDALTLIRSLWDHGRILVDDSEYQFLNNHGLSQDAGLLLLAEYTIPFLDEATGWQTHARARYKDTLFRLTNEDEGIWLEHSVSYQFFMINLMRRVANQTPLNDPDIDSLLETMMDSAAWFVMPNEKQPQIGDTDYLKAPGWALGPAATKTGLQVFPGSGWAVVKLPDSYFITSSTYFSTTHKQSDELSFELFEDDERVVVDGGRYSYTESDPFRIHIRSAQAHNGLLVDDLGFTWKNRPFYGSGIVASGTNDTWYAVLARNPLVEPQGVSHQRLFLYSPSSALVILDEVTTGSSHAYTRLFHLGPTIGVGGTNFVRLDGETFAGRLKDYSGTGTTPSVVKGLTDPFQGWTSPGEAQKVATNTVLLRNVRASSLHTAAMALDDVALAVSSVKKTGSTYALTLKIGDRRSRIYVTQDGSFLTITERLT